MMRGSTSTAKEEGEKDRPSHDTSVLYCMSPWPAGRERERERGGTCHRFKCWTANRALTERSPTTCADVPKAAA